MDKYHHEDLPWQEYILRIRDLFQKQSLDYEKVSSEYGKLAFSHLMLLNGGGLGSIPALSILFDFKILSVTERIELFAAPFFAFLFGSVFAIGGAFAAYVNYQAVVAHVEAMRDEEIARANKFHPVAFDNDDYVKLVDNTIIDATSRRSKFWSLLRLWYFVAIIAGFASLFSFACGCALLAAKGVPS